MNTIDNEISALKTQAYDISREIQRLSAILQQVNNAIAQKEYERDNPQPAQADLEASLEDKLKAVKGKKTKGVAMPAGASLD